METARLFHAHPASDSCVEWRRSPERVDYLDAVAAMEARVAAVESGSARELLWLLEHPPIYTAGTSAKNDEILEPRFPVFQAGRGGRHTYHGPGQRVGYIVMDLRKRRRDLRRYVSDLEQWVRLALVRLGVEAAPRAGRVGLWVVRPDGTEEKIAAIGVRVRRWIAFHGISLNVSPDLDHFTGIVPCGLSGYGVTSLAALGATSDLLRVDAALLASFREAFAVCLELEKVRP